MSSLLKPYRLSVGLALFGAVGEAGSDLLLPWPLKLLFDQLFGRKPLPHGVATVVGAVFGHGPLAILYFALSGLLLTTLLGSASSFAQDYYMPRVGQWVMHDLRRKLYWHIQSLSLAYHDERRLGDIMNTLTGDIKVVSDMIEAALVGVIMNSLSLAGMIVVMFVIDWRFSLLALSVAPLLSWVVYRSTRSIKQASRDVRKHEGAVASVALEVLSSIRVVQAFTREDYEQTRFEKKNEERVHAGIRAKTLQALRKAKVEVLVAAGTVVVLWYGTHHVLNGTLMPGALLVFLAYLNRMYKPLRGLSKESDVISRAAVGFERVVEILDTECTVKDLPGAQPAAALAGNITFENVSFRYPGGPPVLKDISFTAKAGQVIALVGSTGAGKTTLVSLVPRFQDPTAGRVSIDGRDIRDYTLSSLRRQVSLVLQETVLFYGTLRDNIAYGRPEATQEEIVAAARAANADEFIDRMADGYETVVGERGVTISGGQRQRIAIARAMIRNSPILLLDEPTTGLDASSEALVLDGLSHLIEGRTAIIIAHRLSTIARADLILVLENGEIVERGTHEELLRAGGRYWELFRLQFRIQAPVACQEGYEWLQ